MFVKQIEFNWNFLKLRWMPKEHFGSSSGDQPTSRFFKSLLLQVVQLSHFLGEGEEDLWLDAAKSRTDAGRLWTSTKHCRPPTSLRQLQATHLIIYPKPFNSSKYCPLEPFLAERATDPSKPQFLVIAFHIHSTAQCTVISSWASHFPLLQSFVYQLYHLSTRTQHSASTFDDRHAITFGNTLRTSKMKFGQIIRMEINNDSINWESHLVKDPDGDKFWFNKLRIASDDPECLPKVRE